MMDIDSYTTEDDDGHSEEFWEIYDLTKEDLECLSEIFDEADSYLNTELSNEEAKNWHKLRDKIINLLRVE